MKIAILNALLLNYLKLSAICDNIVELGESFALMLELLKSMSRQPRYLRYENNADPAAAAENECGERALQNFAGPVVE